MRRLKGPILAAPSTIRVHARRAADGWTDVKVLIRHPMFSGFEKEDGLLMVPHYIEKVTFTHKNRTVFLADWGPAVSRDPFMEFRFRGAASGDALEVRWVDNKGMFDALTTRIA